MSEYIEDNKSYISHCWKGIHKYREEERKNPEMLHWNW